MERKKAKLQDIVPKERARRKSSAGISSGVDRRVQSDIVEQRSRREPVRAQRVVEEQKERSEESRAVPPQKRSSRRPSTGSGRPSSSLAVWFFAIFGALALAVGLSFFFGGAKVTVVVKQAEAFVEGTFAALPAGESASGEVLAYDTLSLEAVKSGTVAATGESEVSERASGEITVYNVYSTESQRLISNTRFETPEGLIFRIREATIVPGMTEGDGEITPGRVTVTVYADEPGERYNIPRTDFTIPGFSGSPRFDGFYGRSETPLTGGYSGVRFLAADEDIEKARDNLRQSLREELTARALEEMPEGFYSNENLIVFSFTSVTPQNAEGGREVLIEEQARASAVLLPEVPFAQVLASGVLTDYSLGELRIDTMDEMEIALITEDPAASGFPVEEEISLSVSGLAHFVWIFDEKALREDLVGKTREGLRTVLSKYPSIERAKVVFRPLWLNSFPDNPDEIVIEATLDDLE